MLSDRNKVQSLAPGKEVKNHAELADGVVISRILTFLAPKTFDSATVLRPSDDNWLIKVHEFIAFASTAI